MTEWIGSRLRGGLSGAAGRAAALNTSMMLMEQWLRLIAGVFVGLYVARFLGPTDFGLFSFAIAFASLFGAFAKLGLDAIVVRELVRRRDDRQRILSTSLCLKLVGGVAAIAAICACIPSISGDRVVRLYVLIVAAGLVFQAFEVVDFYYLSVSRGGYSALARVMQLVISSVAKLLLVWRHAELRWFVWIALADQITLAVSYAALALRSGLARDLVGFYPREARSLLGNSWPMILSGMAIMIYVRIDQVMIESMLGHAAVGTYSAAVRLSEVWYFVPIIVCNAAFPLLLSAKAADPQLYQARLRQLYAFMLFIGLAVAAVVSVAARPIIGLLYGVAYEGAAAILRVHIWAGIFVCVGVANEKWFVAEGRLLRYTRNVFIGALINVALNYWLIPARGPIGAATATLVSYAAASYVLLLFDSITRGAFWAITTSFRVLWSANRVEDGRR